MPISIPGFHTNTPLDPSFDKDMRNLHVIYYYSAFNPDGTPTRWKYDLWFFSHDRVVYEIHGGPMKGRKNFQTCAYQCIRPGELWQVNWLEETGTVVSMAVDLTNKRITTMMGFSKGHWEHAQEAHGDKRNPADFERWRQLGEIGNQRDRLIFSAYGDIGEMFRGPGDLEPIAPDAVTL